MNQRLAHVTLLVRSYDEAIAFYTNVLSFTLASDLDMGDGKRWVVVSPPGPAGCSLLLAKLRPTRKSKPWADRVQAASGCFCIPMIFGVTIQCCKAAASVSSKRRALRCTATSPCSKTCTAISGTCWSHWANSRLNKKARCASCNGPFYL